MKKILVFVFLCNLAATLFAQTGWRENEMEIRVNITTKYQALHLYDLKLNGDYYGRYAILYVIPEELEKIKTLNLDYQIIIDDLNAFAQGFWNQRDAYHSYQEIIDLMDSLATSFPDICMKTSFGLSVEGRQLAALKISDDVQDDEPEAEVMFDGGIHGNEIGAAENCIRFARHLCLSYGNDPEITQLINNREIWIYVMVNPDGREGTPPYRTNSNGVDLNRDWGYMWDGWGNSSSPYSQPESKALRTCVFGNQFVIHTTYHSGTQYVSYPWSYRYSDCPDEDHIDYLAALYSSSSGYPSISYGQGSQGMYPINGSTKDSNYGIMGSVSWSMEISFNKQPPSSEIMKYYNYNEPAMITMIEYAGYGIWGMVTDSVSGEPVAALIRIDDSFPTYADPEIGDYHKYLIPGTYSITAMANGYITKTIDSVVISGYDEVVRQDIELAPQYGHYVYKICNTHIPDNNDADEGNTPAVFSAPDNVNYSIGKHGSVVMDMQNPIPLGPIHEFTVYEGDMSPESYYCFISESQDGPWTNLGFSTGTTEFNIPESAGDSIRYIKIQDDGDGPQNMNNAGFDLDAIAVTDQSNIIQLIAVDCYIVDTAGGNGNGQIDPGETVEVVIPLTNQGDFTAENTFGKIKSDPFYIYVNQDSAFYGDIPSGDTVTRSFSITADPATPNGHFIVIRLEVDANDGFYTNTYLFPFNVGQITVGIVDLDEVSTSGLAMQNCCENLDISYQYMNEFPESHIAHKHLFVCLGTGDEKHVLTHPEGEWLYTYLVMFNGNLYMEGGDTWYNDPQTDVHPLFHIEASENGSGDLGNIEGIPGTFVQDMGFVYAGDNVSIDHLLPETSSDAFSIFNNDNPAYTCGIANVEMDYNTIGTSFEFGGLQEGTFPSTQEELFSRYLDFFDGLYTGIEQTYHADISQIIASIYPNPFQGHCTIQYELTQDNQLEIIIYNMAGEKVNILQKSKQAAGKHQIVWDGTNDNGFILPAGIYLCFIKSLNQTMTKRLIINPK